MLHQSRLSTAIARDGARNTLMPRYSHKSHVSSLYSGLLSSSEGSIESRVLLRRSRARRARTRPRSSGHLSLCAPTRSRPAPPPRLRYSHLHRPAPLPQPGPEGLGTQQPAPSLIRRRTQPASLPDQARPRECACARPSAGELAAERSGLPRAPRQLRHCESDQSELN